MDLHSFRVGTSNGQAAILDLTNPSHKPLVPTEPGGGPSTNTNSMSAGITAVTWNSQVAHIVATAAGDGSVPVWDLKSKKTWCEIRTEQTGQAVADIHWNPSQGLHLLTASADDRNPVIRVWDLRASTSMPVATLTGHTGGF
jgi:protein transport protein SEC31